MGGITQDCLDDSNVTPSAVSMHESRNLNLIWTARECRKDRHMDKAEIGWVWALC